MHNSVVPKQIKQREAVREAKQRALVEVGRTRFGGSRKLHLVYVHGEPYIASEGDLASLRTGETPSDLELAQPADENDPFAGYP